MKSSIRHFRKLSLLQRRNICGYIENCNPPDGYVWARTPFGAPPGRYKVYLKKFTLPKYHDTSLEKEFEKILHGIGYAEKKDYIKQYNAFGFYLDFAFPEIKVAFEPGATYWHIPPTVEGEKVNPFGLSPEEVYFPPKPEDIRKNEILTSNGWIVGWLNEDFVHHIEDVKECVKSIVEQRQKRIKVLKKHAEKIGIPLEDVIKIHGILKNRIRIGVKRLIDENAIPIKGHLLNAVSIPGVGPDNLTLILISSLKNLSHEEYKYTYAVILDSEGNIISTQEIQLRKDPIYVMFNVFEDDEVDNRVIALIEALDKDSPNRGYGYGINIDSPEFSEPGEFEIDFRNPHLYRVIISKTQKTFKEDIKRRKITPTPPSFLVQYDTDAKMISEIMKNALIKKYGEDLVENAIRWVKKHRSFLSEHSNYFWMTVEAKCEEYKRYGRFLNI